MFLLSACLLQVQGYCQHCPQDPDAEGGGQDHHHYSGSYP